MAHVVRTTLAIAASPQRILNTLADFEAYPTWEDWVASGVVVARDMDGRPTQVWITAAALGLKAILILDVTVGPSSLEHHLAEVTELLARIDSEYVVAKNAPRRSTVTMTVTVALRGLVDAPGYITENMIRQGAKDHLARLKNYSEHR